MPSLPTTPNGPIAPDPPRNSMADLELLWQLPGSLNRDVHRAYHEAHAAALRCKYEGLAMEDVPIWQLS